MAAAEGGGRRCARCRCRVDDAGSLSPALLEALLARAQEEAERVCLRAELEEGRPRLASGVAAAVLLVALAGCATPGAAPTIEPLSFTELLAGTDELVEGRGVVAGVVQNYDGVPLEDAVVVLQSTALEQQREHLTSARGVYVFDDLPPGNYTIQVLAGEANVSRITALAAGERFRANFRVDPERRDEVLLGMVVREATIPMEAASTYHSDLVWSGG